MFPGQLSCSHVSQVCVKVLLWLKFVCLLLFFSFFFFPHPLFLLSPTVTQSVRHWSCVAVVSCHCRMCIFGGQAVQIILCRGHTLHCTTVFVDTFSWKWWVWNLEEESPGGPENAWHISHSPFASSLLRVLWTPFCIL